jgi:hypothetical protein
MPDGARGPGGSCFTERDVNATSLWSTVGDILVILVADAATNISIQAADSIRRRRPSTSSRLTAQTSSDTRRVGQ